MQKSAGGNGLFGKGTQGEVYSQLFNEAMSNQMATQNTVGVAQLMMKHLGKNGDMSTVTNEKTVHDMKNMLLYAKPFDQNIR